MWLLLLVVFFFQAEDGIRDLVRSRGLGDVYKRQAVGSLNSWWFYVSTASGILLTHLLWRISSGQPGRILPSWALAGTPPLAWSFGMVAPRPLVQQALAVRQRCVYYTLKAATGDLGESLVGGEN